MNEAEFPLMLVLQIVLPLFVLSVVLIFVIVAGRKKFKLAAKKLILSVKTTEDSERDALHAFITEKLGYAEGDAKKKTKKIINERKFLIRNLVSGLLDKNVEAISQLNGDLSRVTDCYKNLEVINAQAEEHTELVEQELQESEEEKELKIEVKSLKQEVHITLTTLNNIFKEFSSMFGEDDIPEGQMSVDQIITAMESFSGKKVEDANESEAIEKSEVEEEQTIDEVSEPEATEFSSESTSEVESEPAPKTEPMSTEPDEEVESAPQPDASGEVEEPESQLKPEQPQVETETNTESEPIEELDFAIDSAIDDIDSALDGLELDATDEEPDWGDAFAESGDKMEGDPK